MQILEHCQYIVAVTDKFMHNLWNRFEHRKSKQCCKLQNCCFGKETIISQVIWHLYNTQTYWFFFFLYLHLCGFFFLILYRLILLIVVILSNEEIVTPQFNYMYGSNLRAQLWYQRWFWIRNACSFWWTTAPRMDENFDSKKLSTDKCKSVGTIFLILFSSTAFLFFSPHVSLYHLKAVKGQTHSRCNFH